MKRGAGRGGYEEACEVRGGWGCEHEEAHEGRREGCESEEAQTKVDIRNRERENKKTKIHVSREGQETRVFHLCTGEGVRRLLQEANKLLGLSTDTKRRVGGGGLQLVASEEQIDTKHENTGKKHIRGKFLDLHVALAR